MAYYGGGGQQPPPQYSQPVLRDPHVNYGAGPPPPQGYPHPGHPTGPGPGPAASVGGGGRVPPPPPQLSNYSNNNNGYPPYQHQAGGGGDPYAGGYAPQLPPHQQQEQHPHPPQYGSSVGYHDAGQGQVGGGYGYGGGQHQQQQPPPQAGYYNPHPQQLQGGPPPPHQFNGQPGQGQGQAPVTVALPAASPKNASKMVTMTGIVTQMQPGAFGMISEEIFFQDGLVTDGLTLKVGDKVVVEAEPVSGMPFKYNAKKVTKLDVDLVSNVGDRGHLQPPPQNQYKPESPSLDLGPLPSLPTTLNLPRPVPAPNLTDSSFMTSMGQGQGLLPTHGQSQDQPKPLKSILKNRNPPPPPVLSSMSTTSAPSGGGGDEEGRGHGKRSRAQQHRHQTVDESHSHRRTQAQAPPTSFSIDLDRIIPRVLPGGPGHRMNDSVEFAEYTYINKERPSGMPLPPEENQSQRPESRSPQVTRLLPKSPIPEYGGGREREPGKKKSKHRSRSRSRSRSPSPSRIDKSEKSTSRPHRRSRSRSPSSRNRKRRSMSRSKSRSISPDVRKKSRIRRSRSKSRSRSRSPSKNRNRRVRRSRSKSRSRSVSKDRSRRVRRSRSKSRSRSVSKDRNWRVRRSRSRSRSKSRDRRKSSRPSRRSRSRSRSDSRSRRSRAGDADAGKRSPNPRIRRRSSSGSSIIEVSPRPSREDSDPDANNGGVTVLGKTVTHGIVVKRVVSNLFPRMSDRGVKAVPQNEHMIKLNSVKNKILTEAHLKLDFAASKNSGPVPIKFQISNPSASKPGTGTTLPNPVFSRVPPPLPESGKQAFVNLCKTIQNDDPASRKKKKKEQEPAFKIVDKSKVATSTASTNPPEKFSAEEKIRQWEAERQQLKRIIVDKIGLANQAKNNKYSDPTAVQKLRMTIQNDLNELKYKEAEIAAANAVMSKSAAKNAPAPEIKMPENPAEIQQLKETLQRDLSQRSRSKSQEKEKAEEKTEQIKRKPQAHQELTKTIGDGVQQALKDLRSKFESKKNEAQPSTSKSTTRVSPPTPPPTRRPRSRTPPPPTPPPTRRPRSRTPPPPTKHQDEELLEDDDPYYDGVMAYDPVLEKVMEEIHKQRFMEEKERLRYNGDQAALDSLYYMNDRRTRRGKEMHLIYLRKQEAQMKRERDYVALDRFVDQYGPEAKRRQQEEDLREFRIQEERKTPRVQMEAIRRQEEEYYAWLEDEALARIRSSRNRGGEGRVLRRRTPSPGPSTSRGGGGPPHPHPHPPHGYPPHGHPHPPPLMEDYGHDGYGYYGGDGGPPCPPGPPGHWMEGGGWHPEMEDEMYYGRGDYGRFPMPR